MQKKSALEIVVITVKLLVICAGIALLVAGVNYLTKDKIAENELEKTTKALAELFGKDSEFTDITKDVTLADAVNTVYEAKDTSGKVLGYCAAVSPKGFAGEINMLVAVDASNKILGVSVVSMSETKGIGTKILDPKFLNQFKGKSINIAYSSKDGGVDTISGATKTSKPTIDGVNMATKVLGTFLGGKKGGTNE